MCCRSSGQSICTVVRGSNEVISTETGQEYLADRLSDDNESDGTFVIFLSF